MTVYISLGGQRLGPFNEEELRERIASRNISLSDLAWKEGEPTWKPLNQMPEVVELVVPPLPRDSEKQGGRAEEDLSPVEGDLCTHCGQGWEPTATFCIYCGTAKPTLAANAHKATYGQLLWRRTLAFVIDYGILTLANVILFWVAKKVDSGWSWLAATVLSLGLLGFYWSVMESSTAQASLGKKMLKLRVTGLDGQRIGWMRAFRRTLFVWCMHIVALVVIFLAGALATDIGIVIAGLGYAAFSAAFFQDTITRTQVVLDQTRGRKV